jgi:hypothetical protein
MNLEYTMLSEISHVYKDVESKNVNVIERMAVGGARGSLEGVRVWGDGQII